jgi:hypothetical protein
VRYARSFARLTVVVVEVAVCALCEVVSARLGRPGDLWDVVDPFVSAE